jgi:hypothetical protein
MKEQMCENGASSVADFRFERKAMAMNTEEVRSGECVLMFVVRMENLRMKMNTIDGGSVGIAAISLRATQFTRDSTEFESSHSDKFRRNFV